MFPVSAPQAATPPTAPSPNPGWLAPAQVDVTGGGPLAVVVTFLLAWLFYAVTLHLAATFFVGDVTHQRAAAASLPPAIVSILLQRYDPIVFLPVSLLGAVLAIHFVYRLRFRTATVLGLLHLAFATALGLALYNLIGYL
jgi:hypothetical protein